MKSILYAGAALMACAAIYGFVDFKKTNTRAEFKSMYDEKETMQPASVPQDKSKSTADLPRKVESKRVIPVEEHEIKESAMGPDPKKVSLSKDDDKEISKELFSRAPLRKIPEKGVSGKLKKSSLKESKADF